MIGGDAVVASIHESLARGEVGLQVAAYLRGELVVDAWGGNADERGNPVGEDTVFWAASAGKVSTATALHIQVERGLVSYDDTISSIWPEFAANGKEGLTVGEAVTHRVGLAALPEGTTPQKLGDWGWMTERLAAAAPDLEPGIRTAYHPMTWGYIVGEIVRRSDPKGRSFAEFARDEVHAPLGITDLWHLFPASDNHRVALINGELVRAGRPTIVITEDDERNTAEYWQRINPSGAMMTARAGAGLYAMYAESGVLDGTRLLPSDTVRWFLTPRPDAFVPDKVAGRIRPIGVGGLWLGGDVQGREEIVGFGKKILWHPGGGGTIGFADLDARLAVVICHNRFYDWEGRTLGQHPFTPIVRAIYQEFVG